MNFNRENNINFSPVSISKETRSGAQPKSPLRCCDRAEETRTATTQAQRDVDDNRIFDGVGSRALIYLEKKGALLEGRRQHRSETMQAGAGVS